MRLRTVLACLLWSALPALALASAADGPPRAPAARATEGARDADAPMRTVYRCTRGGTVSLSSAPEPGSRCTGITYDANSAKVPDLWQVPGEQRGVLYQRQQDGLTVYGTRKLPGSTPVLDFSVAAPPDSPAHAGLGDLGPPQLQRYPEAFRGAARLIGVDEALLRTIAHVESGFDPEAVSAKGAMGMMQLMPEVVAAYEVSNPFDPNQSIQAGARLLRELTRRYPGDMDRVAAAYNAGTRAVDRHGGVPPYAETRAYVAKVTALLPRYRAGLAAKPKPR
jgi:hypothetical protein